jgi:hypothetical protein
MNNDTLLKIEIPYIYLFDSTFQILPDTTVLHQIVLSTSNIQFSYIPINSPYPSDTIMLPNNRGCLKDTIEADSNQRAFYITRQMLPPNNKDITISAFFICDGDFSRHNQELKSISPEINKIDSLKIKITYLDGYNQNPRDTLKIDWVKIETPHARRFLQGAFDQDIRSSVQRDLDSTLRPALASRGVRLLRFDTNVEGGIFNWIAVKYFNKLVGNLSCSEVGTSYPGHYELNFSSYYLSTISSRYPKNIVRPVSEAKAIALLIAGV